MNKIKIVCDSLSDITQDYLDLYDIEMLPISVNIDGVEYMGPSMNALRATVRRATISSIFLPRQVLQVPTKVPC